MSEVGKEIDKVVKDAIAPILKSAGFKKSGRTFHRVRSESTVLVNVQASQFNDRNEGRFTINLGHYDPEIAQRLGMSALSGPPKEYQCTFSKRIGQLLPEGNDKWWIVTPGEDNSAISNDVTHAIQQYALPWLSRVETLPGLTDYLRNERSFDAATILNALGEKKSAEACLRRLIELHPELWQRVEEWAHKLGIDLSVERE